MSGQAGRYGMAGSFQGTRCGGALGRSSMEINVPLRGQTTKVHYAGRGHGGGHSAKPVEATLQRFSSEKSCMLMSPTGPTVAEQSGRTPFGDVTRSWPVPLFFFDVTDVAQSTTRTRSGPRWRGQTFPRRLFL